MPEQLDADLLAHLTQVAEVSPVVTTIAQGKANRIAGVDRDGVWLETDATDEKGSGAKLVPAWMLNAGWRHLRSTGSLTNRFLLDELNVKRSSAVCALLARVPGVTISSSSPIVLTYEAGPTSAG